MPHLSLSTMHHFPYLLPPHRLLSSQKMPPRQLRQPFAPLRLFAVNHCLWRVCRDLARGLSTSTSSDEIETLRLKWVMPCRQISLLIC
ncbi:E3 ubiquitin-protein ligase complex slx8-rfp subunit slx8 [Pyrus ussuriensis x Pyrus communis]|uniref:E3 ubiquitin-protein ligase complex slx8-rfp subunit slx8 n=1 Tax=Pyrus ussuriensis x Pyrus communis TaxID=2448454 RepID=A0A5N5EZB8_9ROSA|nr:E3 ubiquitin-protein ligase complex slx8-rfp subunit slx8 [Pyrus ussuriensis x Pyrus communis]